jgi:hypothetical protein
MIAEQMVDQITHAPIPERLHVIEVILESLKHDMPSETVEETGQQSDQLLGLFAEEAELVDEITEAAMQARERDALRVA